MSKSFSYTLCREHKEPFAKTILEINMDKGEISTTNDNDVPAFTEDDFTDIALLVEDQQLFTNRSLLAFASPVFSCMFTAEFKEKGEKVSSH